MQFTILINQSRALEWGLNAQQAFLFAYLYGCPAWAETCNVDGDLYFRLSKKKVCEDLPLLTDKPNTIHKILKCLESAGLILMAVFDNETHISITEKGIGWNRSEGVEKNPTLGKKSTEGVEKNPHRGGKKSTVGVEKNPTNQSISNKIIKLDNYELNNSPDFSPVDSIFDHWKKTMNHPKARLDEKRKKKIREALKLGYTQADLIAAIDGCAKSPYHMGNDGRNFTVYDDLELILRDAKHIDQFLKIYAMPKAPMASQPKFDPVAYVNQTQGAAQKPIDNRDFPLRAIGNGH
jgi:hypothetical protein